MSRRAVVAALLPTLVAAPVFAAEWSIEPSVSLRAEYYDNFELSPDEKVSVWGGTLSPRVRFTGATEALSVAGDLDLRIRRYANHPEHDVDGYGLSVLSTYKTERDLAGVDLRASRDASTFSEFLETGVVLSSRTSDQWSIAPYWTRSLTERTSLTTRYAYRASDSNEDDAVGATGYSNQRLSVGTQTRIDETKSLAAEAFYERYRSRPDTTRQDSYGISGSYNHAFSETLSGAVTAGWRWSRSTLSAGARICDGPIIASECTGSIVEVTEQRRLDDSGGILNALLMWRRESDALTGQISQDIFPSSTGSVTQTRRISGSWARQWSERVGSSMDVSAYDTNAIGAVIGSGDSTAAQFNLRVSYRLAEEWSLDAGYSYTRQKHDTEPAAATQNLVYVTVAYTGRKIAISR